MHSILLTFSFFSCFRIVAQVQSIPDTMELEEVEIRQKASTNSLVVSRFSMDVPYFGGAAEQPHDELVKTPCFYDVGIHFQRQFCWHKSEQAVVISAGVSNVFNTYQSDFDNTKFRDSNYTYGPSKPRCFSISIHYQLSEKHD